MDPPLQFEQVDGIMLIQYHYASDSEDDESEDEEDTELGDVGILIFVNILRQIVLEFGQNNEDQLEDNVDEEEEEEHLDALAFEFQNGLKFIAQHYSDSEEDDESEDEDREWGDVESLFFLHLLRQVVLKMEGNDDELEDDVAEEEHPDALAFEFQNGLKFIAHHYYASDSEDEDREWGDVESLFFLHLLRQVVLEMEENDDEMQEEDDVAEEEQHLDALAFEFQNGLKFIAQHYSDSEEDDESEDEDREWGDVESLFFLHLLRQVVLEMEENDDELEDDVAEEEHLDAFELMELYHVGGEEVSDDEDGEEVVSDNEEEEEVVSDDEDERADVEVALERNLTAIEKDDVIGKYDVQLPQQQEEGVFHKKA